MVTVQGRVSQSHPGKHGPADLIDRAVDLAAHEGYPGHHVYNALLEKALVRDAAGWSLVFIRFFSPQSLIAEGTANFGRDLVFTRAKK